ncbi:hypothetical protein FHS77_002692 [Paenochrobactrum gallinarii]|uniref:Uncharacterized protein n=1 Tax=Paenochrobactrum gallinarii TaxID=643673 RepID=A0A841M9A2_9HYPH|nr:hypothetical protein [Paenochrobactrum gallinarii]MBB6262124.1 hypothetical protein [Paenochrobactrum gallinarii]
MAKPTIMKHRADLLKLKADIEHGLKTIPDITTRRYLEEKYYQVERLLKELAA